MMRLLLNTSIVKFASLLGALAFSWLLSLLLPISDAGQIFAILAILPGIAVVVGFGVDQTVLRLGVKRYAELGNTGLARVMGYGARSILRRAAVLALITLLVAPMIWYVFPQQKDAFLRWFLALVMAPFFAALVPAAMGFRVQSRYARSILAEPSAVMTFAACTFGMLAIFFQPQFWLAYGAYGVFLVVLSLPLFRVVLDGRGEVVEHDLHFGITQVAQYLLQWGVVGQISFYATNEEIAAISLSMRMVIIINIILVLMNTVNSNKISQFLQAEQYGELRKLLRKQSPILFSVGVCAAITLGLLAPYVYGFLGPGFETAKDVTRILILGQLVNVLVGPANLMLNMSGNARTTSLITISVGVPVTALVWPFYQYGGAFGAALLISLSLCVASILSALMALRATGICPVWPAAGGG